MEISKDFLRRSLIESQSDLQEGERKISRKIHLDLTNKRFYTIADGKKTRLNTGWEYAFAYLARQFFNPDPLRDEGILEFVLTKFEFRQILSYALLPLEVIATVLDGRPTQTSLLNDKQFNRLKKSFLRFFKQSAYRRIAEN